MPTSSRGLGRRIRDQFWFSVIAIVVLFLILRLFGVRAAIPSLFGSIILTIALNVGLSYWSEHRARTASGRPARSARGGGDIRIREDDER